MKTPRTTSKIQKQLNDLSLAVPEIVAHRLLNPSNQETERMVSEKTQAFADSWIGMYAVISTLPLQWSEDWMQGLATGRGMSAAKVLGDLNRVAEAGMKPVHKTAMANKRRFRKQG